MFGWIQLEKLTLLDVGSDQATMDADHEGRESDHLELLHC